MKNLSAVLMRKFFNFLGYSGAMFIMYGVASAGTGSTWPILERWVTPFSAFLTLIGTIVISFSVYIHSSRIHPPEEFSKYISAPIVIISCLIAIAFLFIGGSLPFVIVNGFALLGISGSFFRIQRRPTNY